MTGPVTISLLGEPVPWARAGTRSGHHYTPTRQRNNAATLQRAAEAAMVETGYPVPLDGPLSLEVFAEIGIPASWSKRKKNAAILGNIHPTGRPDLDNIVKQIKDALTSVVYRDDALICVIRARKRYGVQPKLVITVAPITG